MIINRLVNGENIHEQCAVQFSKQADVIVAGAGVAGSVAAIASADNGLKTLAVERLNCMGGLGTSGFVLGYYGSTVEGLTKELDIMAKELSADYPELNPWAEGIHPEARSIVYDRELKKRGGEIYYESAITAVYTKGSSIVGVKIFTEETFINVGCKIVIDCSGDAAISRLLGLKLSKGREIDQATQPYSALYMKKNSHGKLEQAYLDNGYVDVASAWDVSRAIKEGYAHYGEHESILEYAGLIGIREGFMAHCKERVTIEDALSGAEVPQPLFTAISNYDLHCPDLAFEKDCVNDWLLVNGYTDRKIYVQIPMGALIADGVDNLLVAGRCIDADHEVQGIIRMKQNCTQMGEYAAKIAAISIQEGKALTDCYPNNKPGQWISALQKAGTSREKCKFIYLLGKNMCKESIDLLFSYLNDTTDFDVFSYAFRALMRFDEAKERLRTVVMKDDFKINMPLKSFNNSCASTVVVDRTGFIRALAQR